MQQAAACAAAGNVQGELAAYGQADDLGDAEAAFSLGNALRSQGEIAAAKEALERAEVVRAHGVTLPLDSYELELLDQQPSNRHLRQRLT